MGVSRATAYKWVRRYREEGSRGLHDRAPVARRRPHALPAGCVKRICAARLRRRRGPHYLAHTLGIPRSTIYGVLRRAGLHRLDWIDRPTRTVVRYERARPGELVHVDVKKLGRIPPGGGKRFFPGFDGQHFTSPPGRPVSNSRLGYDYLHVAIDDHSRLAYLEPLADERQRAASGFLERMHRHFASLGVRVERVLTDNGSAYRSRMFAQSAQKLGIKLKKTRAYRPQTNGKVERFNRTLLAEEVDDLFALPVRVELRARAEPGKRFVYLPHQPHRVGRRPFSPTVRYAGRRRGETASWARFCTPAGPRTRRRRQVPRRSGADGCT